MITADEEKFNILIVEDEPLICAGLAEKIPWADYGFSVAGRAKNGVEAAEMIAASSPDVVLSDVRMPRMDGLELAAWIRNNHYPIEIILLSGFSDFNYARQAIKYDVVAYLLKPLDHAELAEAIEKVISRLLNKIKIPDEISNQIMTPGTNLELVDIGLVERVKSFVEKNYMTNMNLKTVAEHLVVNPSYLSRIFVQKAGCDFTDFLNDLRMSKAMKLLQQTNQSIMSVARHSGYLNDKYFSRLFKIKTGISPNEFRSRSRL